MTLSHPGRLRLIGLDPGLGTTGWGLIEVEGNRLSWIAQGTVTSDATENLARRLACLYDGLALVIAQWQPAEAAVEETFVNKNPVSTLRLGQARAVALLAPARAGIHVAEYPANVVKKSVVGTGHADKRQVQMMVARLLPGAPAAGTDTADALAVAICHAHLGLTNRAWGATSRFDLRASR